MQPSQPSMVPEWYDDDRPTQRDALVTAAVPAVSSSPGRPLLTVLVGLNEGQVFALDRAETFIGRGRDAHVGVDDAGISRRHARIVRLVGPRYVIEDLHSANGVFVNGRKIEHVELVDGDRIQVGARLVLRFGFLSADEEALAHKLYEGSTRDALTGLRNRRHVDTELPILLARSREDGSPLSIGLVDLDHFKKVNDRFSHALGDTVLVRISGILAAATAESGWAARMGGEEFLLVFPAVPIDEAMRRCEDVCQSIESVRWDGVMAGEVVTASIGFTMLQRGRTSQAALLGAADRNLYAAKNQGRNRVVSDFA